MSMHREDFGEIVAYVAPEDCHRLGKCVWCGYGPPVCHGAAMFVRCTGPRREETYDNGDRCEDTERGIANDSEIALHAGEGS